MSWWRVVAISAAALILAACVMYALRRAPERSSVGDGALLEIYTLHAASGQLTVGPYSRFGWHHPGPSLFYALAPGYVLSGHREDSLLLSVLLLNLLAVAAMLWLANRHGGPAMAYALMAWLVVYYARPTSAWGWDQADLLSSSWNPHAPMLSFALMMMLAAAVATGRLRLLPALVLVASFVMQTHVAFVPTAAAASVAGLALGLAGKLGTRTRAVGAPRENGERVPHWVTALDLLSFFYVGLALWVIWYGGFDTTIAGVRLTVNQVDRLLVIAAAIVLMRHVLFRRRSLPARIARPFRHRGTRIAFATTAVLAVMWLPALVDEIGRPGPGNMLRLAEFFLEPASLDLPTGAVAFTQYMSAPLRPGVEVAAGGRALQAADLSALAVVLTAVQLMLLGAVGWWATRTNRRFLANLCVVCLVAAGVAFGSMSRIRGAVYDHLAFWTSMIGVVALVAITTGLSAWVAVRVGARLRRPVRIRHEAVYAAFLVVFGSYGALHVAYGHHQRRFHEERDVVRYLAATLRDDLRSHQLDDRATLVHISQDAWPVAAGIILELYKRGARLSVTEQWEFIYGPPFAETGRERLDVAIVDSEGNQELSIDPTYRFVAEREGVFLHVRARARELN